MGGFDEHEDVGVGEIARCAAEHGDQWDGNGLYESLKQREEEPAQGERRGFIGGEGACCAFEHLNNAS